MISTPYVNVRGIKKLIRINLHGEIITHNHKILYLKIVGNLNPYFHISILYLIH